MQQQVYADVSDQVMTIRIHNPEMKNGLNWEGIEQLSDCYQQLLTDQTIRAAIVTGDEDYFYTGGRVNANVPGEQKKYADAIERYTDLAGKVTTPMVAAVSGHCLKAGMGMLASCDFAIAREGVEFGYPEVRMGGVPMMVMVDTVGLLPRKRALEAYLTSWNFSAQDAYMMGLVNRVVSKQDFWPTVEKYVRVFLDTPPQLIEMTRRAYNELSAMPSRQQRIEFANKMLRDEVLTTMTKIKTEFNV